MRILSFRPFRIRKAWGVFLWSFRKCRLVISRLIFTFFTQQNIRRFATTKKKCWEHILYKKIFRHYRKIRKKLRKRFLSISRLHFGYFEKLGVPTRVPTCCKRVTDSPYSLEQGVATNTKRREPRLRVPFTADTHDSPHRLLPGVAFTESFPYRIYSSRESTPCIVDATVTINTAKINMVFCTVLLGRIKNWKIRVTFLWLFD